MKSLHEMQHENSPSNVSDEWFRLLKKEQGMESSITSFSFILERCME